MSSEVGNKSLLKRVADSLQIIDPRQMASRLKTDAIIPVVDISRYIGQAPVEPGGSSEWTYRAISTETDLRGDSGGVIDIMGGLEDNDRIVRLLNLHWRLVVAIEDPLGGDSNFGFSLLYPIDEMSQKIVDHQRWDNFNGEALAVSDIRYALHGSTSAITNPASSVPAIPVGDTWNGLIPPGKALNLEWVTGIVVPVSTNSEMTLTVRATYVYGPKSLGVPPI